MNTSCQQVNSVPTEIIGEKKTSKSFNTKFCVVKLIFCAGKLVSLVFILM